MKLARTRKYTRATSTLRAGLVLGTALGIATLAAGCTPTADADTEATDGPAAVTPTASAPSDDAAAETTDAATIPYEAGLVPEGWSAVDGVECGMSAAALVTQDDRFHLDLTDALVTGDDGTEYLPTSLAHELGDDAALDFGDDVQLVWSQGDVVVDLDLGWFEGGGPLLRAADAGGLPTADYATWEEDASDPAQRRISGLAEAGIATTCAAGEEPRPDGAYDVRAVARATVDGESTIVVSDPVAIEWVGPQVD